MTWIKICGITNLEDAQIAVDAGADALGFVFYEKSPRKIEPQVAREIVAKLPQHIEKVGIFVDQTAEQVREAVEHAGLTAVQLYKKECAQALNSEPASTTKSSPKIIFVVSGLLFADAGGIHLKSGLLWGIPSGFQDVLFAIMVDSSSSQQPGGTGQRFDWTRARGAIRALGAIRPTIVAGGLDPSNVAVALALLHQPWGVDVASGVEAKPGKKDPEKVRAFVDAVRKADRKN
jgi:phosphoribosylanthranilate isomerase